MKKKQVNVFDFYLVKDEDKEYYEQFCKFNDLELYHNKIVTDKGYVKLKGHPNVTPLVHHCIFKNKYELGEDEAAALQMFNNSAKQAKDIYDSATRKRDRYSELLIKKACIGLEKDFNELFFGEKWDCSFSPLGYCVYEFDGCSENVCIFCGEPEDRK